MLRQSFGVMFLWLCCILSTYFDAYGARVLKTDEGIVIETNPGSRCLTLSLEGGHLNVVAAN